MTEKEIIKGIEICLRGVTTEECTKCPFQEFGDGCMYEMFRNALNLINRQRAEIEELTEKHHNECRQIAKYDDSLRQYKKSLIKYQEKELERINRKMNSMVNENDKLQTDSKEAVKKFAEALKAELKNLSKVHLFGTTFALVGENFIDGFVAKYEKGENI